MPDLAVTPLPWKTLSSLLQYEFTKGFTKKDLAAIDKRIGDFMRQYSVPGMSVAITRNGGLVYAKGFGVARKRSLWDLLTFRSSEYVDVWHRFRIASISKPITAVAIFRLIQNGQLRLTDTVFGAGSQLGADFGFGSLPSYEQDKLKQVTVQHLLEHTAGGWANDSQDPMFLRPELNHQQLITWVLSTRPLMHTPGTVYSYSNFGYCLLGRIIERVSGQTYADFVQTNVFGPCGITTMEIAGDTLGQRRTGEVAYYGQPYYVTVTAGGVKLVLKYEDEPYAIPVARMDAHGGWIASAIDLVRFAVHVDNFATPADILNPASMTTMLTPTTAKEIGGNDPKYAKGWGRFQDMTQNNWFHFGSLPGTLSLLVRSSNGFCWAVLLNTRRHNTDMATDLDQNVMWPLFKGTTVVKTWPTQDLFPIYDNPWQAVLVTMLKS